jgi:hypothetical protein
MPAHVAPTEMVRKLRQDTSFRDLRNPLFSACHSDLMALAIPWVPFWTTNISVRAENFWAAGGFDEDFRGWGAEDVKLGYRLYRHGVSMRLSRQAWVIELPHDRDISGNTRSNARNIELFLRKHPDPAVEIFWAVYGRGGYDPPPEHEYSLVLAWADQARSLDVRHELRHVYSHVRSSDRVLPRIAVLGCGRAAPEDLSLLRARYTLVDFDSDLLPSAGCEYDTRHAIGLNTTLPARSFDLVIVSSRMRGLWQRWGNDVLAETRRIGLDVKVLFTPS